MFAGYARELTPPSLQSLKHKETCHVKESSLNTPRNPSRRAQNQVAREPPAPDVQIPDTIPDPIPTRMAAMYSQSDGDTQPISPRAYDEFAKRSIARDALNEPSEPLDGINGTREPTERSYHPGQSGHVDLLAAFEQPAKNNNEAPSQSQHEDFDPLSQAVDVRAELYPESRRFQPPKTPATNGKKRNRTGEMIDHNSVTPKSPLNPFAGHMLDGGVMNASQAFKATQAASSPLFHVLHSENSSERPSPDMYGAQRPVTAGPSSSPTKMTGLGLVHAVTEPQTTYVSMKESQAERERRAAQATTNERASASEYSDDDFGSDDSQLRKRRLQKELRSKARDQFVGVTARLRPGSSVKGRRRWEIQHPSSEKVSRGQGDGESSEAIIVSDNFNLPEGENLSEDETEHEEEHAAADIKGTEKLADDNKENVEVPMTNCKDRDPKSPIRTLQSSPTHRAQRHSDDLSSNTPPESIDISDQNDGAYGKIQAAPQGTQKLAIVNSQVSQIRGGLLQTSTRATHEPQSSPNSRVVIPQSQPLTVTDSSPISSSITQSTPLVINNMPFVDSQAAFKLGSSSAALFPDKRRPHPGSNQGNASIVKQDQPFTKQSCMSCSPSPQPNRYQPATTERIADGFTESGFSRTRCRLNQPVQGLLNDSPLLNATTNAEAMNLVSENKNFVPSSSSNLIPSSTPPSTMPETNSTIRRLAVSGGNCMGSTIVTSRNASNTSLPHTSAPSTHFETAQTTIWPSPSKTQLRSPAQKSHGNHLSSESSNLPARTLAQIIAEPSPGDAIGDVDVDVRLFTNDDLEFQNVIKGSSPVEPAQKRQRRACGRELRITEQKSFKTPPPREAALVYEGTDKQDGALTDELSQEYAAKEKHTENESIITTSNVPGDGQSVPNTLRGTKHKKGRLIKVQRPGKVALEHLPMKKKLKSPTLRPESNIPQAQASDSSLTDHRLIVAPNRVFAYFNGDNTAYYPATCLGATNDKEPRYTVRFDDGSIDVVHGYKVKRLELQVGDNVKVDSSGLRNKIYTVQELIYPTALLEQETSVEGGVAVSSMSPPSYPYTDMYGHSAVMVTEKQRRSIDNKQTDGKPALILIANIYLTPNMWPNFKNRSYNFIDVPSAPSSRLQTSSVSRSTSSSPSSRQLKLSTSINSRSFASNSRQSDGLFANIVFAITNITREEDRQRTTRQILSNGGQILADGFDELFDVPDLELVSASKPSPKKHSSSAFGLTQAARCMGFACLIADKHCRMAKYIQALALGIPCLATRWVQDCVLKQRVLPWEAYLLCSGESSFLGGAVRSRVLPHYNPTDVALPSMIESRLKLVDGESVLLIMSKAEEGTMRSHPFFMHALGASRVGRVHNLDAAVKAVSKARAAGEPWGWIYTHANEKQVEKAICVGESSAGAKRRKRGDGTDNGARARTKVVGNEYVIQSLILGRLMV